MTLGCSHSPSVSGGVARRKSRQKNSKLWLGARLGVANASRECGRECESRERSRESESRMGSRNGGREMGSQMGVAKGSRESDSQMWVAKIKKSGGVCKWDPEGSNYLIKKLYKKICSVGNIGPGRLGPFFNRRVP